MSSVSKIVYPHSPIWHEGALARALDVPLANLQNLAKQAQTMYRSQLHVKKDGSSRECFDASPELKRVQERIKVRILRSVSFPRYLMGGIGDPSYPRDHIRNAACHSGARVLMKLDIANFFPSVAAAQVFGIWQHCFGFSKEVAEILTALTTYREMLPQGAKTSTHLANLLFWRAESDLVASLAQRGVRYTRFIDDITISSPANLSRKSLSSALSECLTLIYGSGLRAKRSKQQLNRAGRRMEVTGAIVGKAGPSLAPEKRARIRAAVHQCETVSVICGGSEEFKRALHATCSMVGQMSRLHPEEAQRLKSRLAKLKKVRVSG